MKTILNQLLAHQTLEREQARAVLLDMAQGAVPPAQMAAFMTVYLLRPITAEELDGFRAALLELCVPLDFDGLDTIDLCGTGGDGRDTFNISTLSALVVAACGVPVAKHGNYGVSSVSGSSNVLELLGYRFTADRDALARQLERAGICFLHAPLFHPALKHVAPVRKELGVRTFFNMLGPLVNPAAPAFQCTGVFSLELGRLYHYLLQPAGRAYSVLHSLDGYDEISLTGPFKYFSHTGEAVVDPADWGLPRYTAADLHGGATTGAAAETFLNILNGRGSPAQVDVVCANAAAALRTARPALPVGEALETAREALLSGRALQILQTIIN